MKKWSNIFYQVWYRSAAILLFLVVWEILPRSGMVSRSFLSPPTAVIVAIKDLIVSAELWGHLIASLQRSLSGLVLAIIAGVALGLVVGWFKKFEAFIDPLLQLFRQISAFALFPVFILFLGIGEASKTGIIFWAAFFPILINTVSGVKHVDKLLIDSAKSMGAGQGFIFRKVIIPAAAPSIFTGIRLGGAYCITALVAAEMIGASSGLGFYILNSQEIFQIPHMYAGIILLAFLGLGLNYLLALIESRFTRWKKGLYTE
ncbi:ABC transporter permease [Bacillus sp. 1NLA3E]|uniref:ABC transporter permease n=1 Tax=Bacillus sp. 1NLA3E TaxID=666686 RepID=UPI000247EDEB|nr:ABC transporter permease [Bacillus sp. 1NLA3E]AGK53688.1 taurine transporter permeaseprotein tauC [Bacillus sp. 1NLA3E]